MATLYGVTLLTKGETKKTKLRDGKDKVPLTLETIQTILKKKTTVQALGTYSYNSLNLDLFGYTTGKTGTENKHELPPPFDNLQCFGDILLIAYKKGTSWEHPVNFTTDDYESFYQSALGGNNDDERENEDSEDEDSDEEGEEEEEEEETKVNEKKKAAVEDGVPEDEDDGDHDEEGDDEEEDDEEEEEVEVEQEPGEGEEELVRAPIRKVAAKKKSSKSTAPSQNTGRVFQAQLSKKHGFQEFETVRPIPQTESSEQTYRLHGIKCLTTKFSSIFSKNEIEKLENTILQLTLTDANSKQVLRTFENPLFCNLYMCSLRRLISNLDPKTYVKNTNLLPRLLSKDLSIETLATMNVMDFQPTLYAGLRERMLLREKQQLEGNKAMATDMFKCGRCHKRETTFYELQTRSADEPMTKFITCVNCGNHWRM